MRLSSWGEDGSLRTGHSSRDVDAGVRMFLHESVKVICALDGRSEMPAYGFAQALRMHSRIMRATGGNSPRKWLNREATVISSAVVALQSM